LFVQYLRCEIGAVRPNDRAEFFVHLHTCEELRIAKQLEDRSNRTLELRSEVHLSMRTWRRDLTHLATNLDAEVSAQLARLFATSSVVKEEHMATHLKRGDRVAVPWGLDEVKGVVPDIYGPPGARHVLVRVPFVASTGERSTRLACRTPRTP